MKAVFVLSGVMALAITAFAGSSAENGPAQVPAQRQRIAEKTVFVTGSLIPQRVQLHPTGTATVSPIRIIDRVEIDQTGRFTTPGAFVNDPSVCIIGH